VSRNWNVVLNAESAPSVTLDAVRPTPLPHTEAGVSLSTLPSPVVTVLADPESANPAVLEKSPYDSRIAADADSAATATVAQSARRMKFIISVPLVEAFFFFR